MAWFISQNIRALFGLLSVSVLFSRLNHWYRKLKAVSLTHKLRSRCLSAGKFITKIMWIPDWKSVCYWKLLLEAYSIFLHLQSTILADMLFIITLTLLNLCYCASLFLGISFPQWFVVHGDPKNHLKKIFVVTFYLRRQWISAIVSFWHRYVLIIGLLLIIGLNWHDLLGAIALLHNK